MNIEIANKLYELRRENGLSQEALAEKLNISRQSVSKWERGESSPDTDNLIALAKLYNISLDELLLNDSRGEEKTESEPKECEENTDSSAEENPSSEKDSEEYKGHNFIDIDDGKNTVKIGTKGIYVNEKEGNTVKIDKNGVYVNGSAAEDHIFTRGKKKNKFMVFPYPILVVILFLVLGCTLEAWSTAWLLFLTIPLYYTLIEAIERKNANIFCYPVLMALIYLCMGFFLHLWAWGWIVFLTIPIYYALCPHKDENKK